MYPVEAGHADLRRGRVSARSIKTSLKFLGAALAVLTVAGCASMKTPDRLYSIDEEFNDIRTGVDSIKESFPTLSRGDARRARNNMIAARKYAIDLQYTKYEAALTHEAQATDFAAQIASIALHTTADYVPVEHTARMLNGIGTGVAAADLAYNDKVLRVKLIENLQASMRTARHERSKVIYANMHCSIKTYPVGMALSDLEAYYRAGTFVSGLMKLSQTVNQAETQAATAADAEKPGGEGAQATLDAAAVEAKGKAAAAKLVATTTKGIHKCELVDTADDR
jgi:hypothetical protein